LKPPASLRVCSDAHHGDVVVEVQADVVLVVKVDGVQAKLLFLKVRHLHVPIAYPHPIHVLGVVLHAVAHGEQVKLGKDYSATPVERLFAAL
jgi:hypothetical protein